MQSFYNLKKPTSKKDIKTSSQVITKNKVETIPVEIVETIEISQLACWLFLSQIFHNKIRQTIKKPGSDFKVMTIDKTNPLRPFIDSILQDYEISIARIYEFVPQHKDSAHVDHLFPDKDVIVIRLNQGDPRLKINTKLVSETAGKGYIFPSNLSYEILQGEAIRYSLVLWGNRKFTHQQSS